MTRVEPLRYRAWRRFPPAAAQSFHPERRLREMIAGSEPVNRVGGGELMS